MDINIKELLKKAVGNLPKIRIVWPQEHQLISLKKPDPLATAMYDVFAIYLKSFPECYVCINYGLCGINRPISFSFLPTPISQDFLLNPKEEVLLKIKEKFDILKTLTETEKGEFSNWSGLKVTLLFNRSLICKEPKRRFNIPYKGNSWDDIYQWKLQYHPWSMLRGEVYRFAREAKGIIDWAKSQNMKTVLCPAIGWCIDP